MSRMSRPVEEGAEAGGDGIVRWGAGGCRFGLGWEFEREFKREGEPGEVGEVIVWGSFCTKLKDLG